MSIQQDVLDTIGPNGIDVNELRGRIGNISQNELDVCTNALLRAGKITRTFGRFEWAGSMRTAPKGPVTKIMPPWSAAPNAPGSAASDAPMVEVQGPHTATGEVAASLNEPKFSCKDCKGDLPGSQFQTSNLTGTRLPICRKCMGKRTRGSKVAKVPETVEVSPPPVAEAPIPQPELPPKVVVTDHFVERIRTRRQEAIDANLLAALELEALNSYAAEITAKAAEIRAAVAKRIAYIAQCDAFFAQSETLAEGVL